MDEDELNIRFDALAAQLGAIYVRMQGIEDRLSDVETGLAGTQSAANTREPHGEDAS